MNYFENVLEAVGNTPLIRLGRIERDEGIEAILLAKLEYLNPAGSVKDRPAVRMLEIAEKEGLLGPGGTVVEPTSGNTGAGLAMAAAVKGYRCICVMPDKVSKEKQDLLKAMGAEVIVTPTAPPDDPESYYTVAERLAEEIPGGFKPGQYENPANPLSHYETTGPEIWRQTEGRITHFVAGMGTCGTITGTGRYLKEQSPEVRVVGVDPEGSIFSDPDNIHQYAVEGVGEDFYPGNHDPIRGGRGDPGRRPRVVPHDPPPDVRRGPLRRGLVRDGRRRGGPRGERTARGRRGRRSAARHRTQLRLQGLRR